MSKPILAVIGATGDLGGGLALRWAKAGYRVIIGSRNAEKAEEAAEAMTEALGDVEVTGLSNEAAAEAGDIVAVCVPFSHQKGTLESISHGVQGKIVIDTTVALVPPKVGRVQLPPEGSAGVIAQALLGENVRVVSAFQNVAAHHLQSEGAADCDILVTGNDKEARAEVIALVEAAGLRGFHAGPIQNSAATEALTSVLITINRQFKCHAGLRLTGLSDEEG